MEELSKGDPQLTSKDISLIQTTWTETMEPDAILDSATAFQELGLQKEALNEYQKLLNLDYPVSEAIGKIAESLGYQSIYSFSNLFKTHTGVRPSAYRKRFR